MAITDLEDWLYSSFSREHNNVYDDVKLDGPKRIIAHWRAEIRPITCAGTKGKGSTIRFIESALLACKQNCLAFTSPHVNHINERWRIKGLPAQDEQVLDAAEAVAAAELELNIQLTYFERCFAIAVKLTQIYDVDYFLCEVGLGGRLDCANALDTQAAAITAISYDHCHVLGDTLELIAAEKLAIARADAPLFIAPQSQDALAAIKGQLPDAQEHIFIETDNNLSLQLPGQHQKANASTALAIIKYLQPTLFEKHYSEIIDAFAQVQLAARCQIIHNNNRRIMVDAAHNGESMRACIVCAQQTLAKDFTVIIGCSSDKRLHDICEALPPQHNIVRCGFEWPRACKDKDWPEQAQAWPYYQNIKDALAAVPSTQDCCITGSFYLAGEALSELGQSLCG